MLWDGCGGSRRLREGYLPPMPQVHARLNSTRIVTGHAGKKSDRAFRTRGCPAVIDASRGSKQHAVCIAGVDTVQDFEGCCVCWGTC